MLSFKEIQEKIEREIGQLEFDCPPKSLYEPITYILSLGGKRIRPALVLMAYNLYREDVEKAIRPAIGLEVFHNFTLLHDDLMDQADKRRNKPTVHKVWNANTAILSGDAMLIAAYQLIGETAPEHLKEVLDLFTRTALEICGGQQYDMEFESRMDVSEEEYLEMIRLKTAVLLACSLKTGAILGGAGIPVAGRFVGRLWRYENLREEYRRGYPVQQEDIPADKRPPPCRGRAESSIGALDSAERLRRGGKNRGGY